MENLDTGNCRKERQRFLNEIRIHLKYS